MTESNMAQREEIKRDLKRLYDSIVDEPIPQKWKELLAKMK